METTTDNLFDSITIDYSGFHGPVASAMVYMNDDSKQSHFYREILMIGHNECESNWHDDTCECPTDDYYKQIFAGHMTNGNMTIVTNEKGE